MARSIKTNIPAQPKFTTDGRVVLALDPATHCGWAVGRGDGAGFESGCVNLGVAAPGHPGRTANVLFEFLRRVLQSQAVDVLAYEEATFGAHDPRTQKFHNELAGVIKLFAERNQLELVAANPAHLKQFATGDGRAAKADVRRAVLERWQKPTATSDEADAVALLKLVETGWRPGLPVPGAKHPPRLKKPKPKGLAKKAAALIAQAGGRDLTAAQAAKLFPRRKAGRTSA